MNSLNDTSFFVAKVKVILLGDPTVGKTSIISAIRDIQFKQKHEPTIGIDFFAMKIFKNQKAYKFQFWDTAGQERFRSIIPSYVRNANIGIIVFDVQNRASFDGISNWLETFKQSACQKSKIIIIGNKVDLDSRVVSTEDAERKFQKQNVTYIQISAKNGYQIDKLTQNLVNFIDVSESELAEQDQRSKSYTILQKQTIQGSISGPQLKKCCII